MGESGGYAVRRDDERSAGVRHALLCCEHKKHIVMVNVEADVLAGPLLVRRAKEAGII